MNTIRKLQLEQAIASLEKTNPYQTLATFIFADDRPNGNNQGLPFEKFENVARSAIGMPIKVRFINNILKQDVEDHDGSIPIGSIQSMEIVTIDDNYHQLVATAALWNEEYPKEVEWLEMKFAEGKAPGISYELNYEKDNIIDDIRWIDGDVYTGAATFVKNPAYGARTALLALASLDEKVLEKNIISLAESLSGNKGGNRMDEKEIEALKTELTSLRADASSKQSEIETLTARLTELEGTVKTKDDEISGLKNAALLDSRIRQYTEAGFSLDKDEEKASSKKAILASFSDEQFNHYIAEMVSLKPKSDPATETQKALASLRSTGVPKVEIPEESSLSTLKQGLRDLARPNSIE